MVTAGRHPTKWVDIVREITSDGYVEATWRASLFSRVKERARMVQPGNPKQFIMYPGERFDQTVRVLREEGFTVEPVPPDAILRIYEGAVMVSWGETGA